MTTQVPVPVQAPLQPANIEPAAGVGVSVTEAFALKLKVQVAPQLMPAGELVTVPVPVPDLVVVSANVCRVNTAFTDRAALIVTTQAPVPVQAPLQPANTEPAAGVGVSVTEVPELKLNVQVAPQLMPAGELVTVPVPVPDLGGRQARTSAG